ncbi:MAG: DUF6785 family protein [Elusimicrobiota bacterium]
MNENKIETGNNAVKSEEANGLTWRAALISIVFTIIAALWIGRVEIYSHGCQISESVPPIPAVAGLIFLIILNPLLNMLSNKWKLSRAEILIVYCVLTMSVSMSSVGVVRLLLPFITVPTYFATPENKFDMIAEQLPKWIAPQDKEIVRMMYEGSPDGAVPWGAWLGPLTIWSALFVVLFVTMFFILVIFRKQWVEKERLTFPLIYLPLELTSPSKKNSKSMISDFLKNPAMWIGFGLAFMYNALNILNAVNPDIPAMGATYNIGALFTEQPWKSIQPMTFYYNPAVLGLGYLVSLEVSFSIWLFFFMFKIEQVIGNAIGMQSQNFPFFYSQEQAVGGYIAFALVLVFLARKQIIAVVRKALFNDPNVDDTAEPVSYRTAFFGSIIGFVLLCIFFTLLNIHLVYVIVFVLMIVIVAFVYARIRAETGVPMIWLFPFYQQKRILTYTLGVKSMLDQGASNLIGLSLVSFLARGFFPQITAYQLDTMKLAEEANIKRRKIMSIVVFSLILGLVVSYWLHLSMYYKYGSNVLEGGSAGGSGGFRTGLAVTEYNELSTMLKSPQVANTPKIAATIIGAAFVFGMVVLRRVFLNFPLNPIGFLVSNSYGMPLWGPFLIVWIIKSLILKLGGVDMYKRLIPFFIGITIGHFITAGVIWGAVAAMNPDLTRFYSISFG